MKVSAFLISFLFLYLTACEITELPQAQELELHLPDQLDEYQVSVDNAIPTLGRVLFYDRRLSANNSVSCSSCHKQELAFADNVAFSQGFESKRTARNSMPIQNLGFQFNLIDLMSKDSMGSSKPFDFVPFQQSLFWDGREKSLNTMVLKPIVNHIEMGITDFYALAEKLSAMPYYQNLFIKAYGEPVITTERIADALSWFIQSINSNHTKLDQHFREGNILSGQELNGQRLFFEKYNCNSCHQTQQPNGYLFAEGGSFANIGLEQEYADNGAQLVTKSAGDAGKFKIPSLRNVAVTGPYMHDGRFTTLDEVVDHYKDGIQGHPNLDHRLRNPNQTPKHFPITDSEKKAIIAFLHTLTDPIMLHDPKFSNPFKAQ